MWFRGWWCNNHLETYEFVNGKDDIPYMKWTKKIMFETTSLGLWHNLPNISNSIIPELRRKTNRLLKWDGCLLVEITTMWSHQMEVGLETPLTSNNIYYIHWLQLQVSWTKVTGLINQLSYLGPPTFVRFLAFVVLITLVVWGFHHRTYGELSIKQGPNCGFFLAFFSGICPGGLNQPKGDLPPDVWSEKLYPQIPSRSLVKWTHWGYQIQTIPTFAPDVWSGDVSFCGQNGKNLDLDIPWKVHEKQHNC